MNAMVPQWEIAVAEAEPQFTEIAKQDGNLVAYRREASFALQALQGPNGEYLRKCSPQSIRNAVVNVANVGLSLSPALKLAYLVPRKGVCCLDISYVGLCHLAMETGAVLAVMAETVRENDSFEYVDGFTQPRHKFNPFASVKDRGEIIGVYCVARLKSGVSQVETLSMEEINRIRAVSMAKDGPWSNWFEEMAKKSVIKRASKLWPRSDRLSKAIETLNEHEGDANIQTPISTDASVEDVDAATRVLKQIEETQEALRRDLDGAKTVEEARAVWSRILEACNVIGPPAKPFYDEMKPKVSIRVNELKAAANEVMQ